MPHKPIPTLQESTTFQEKLVNDVVSHDGEEGKKAGKKEGWLKFGLSANAMEPDIDPFLYTECMLKAVRVLVGIVSFLEQAVSMTSVESEQKMERAQTVDQAPDPSHIPHQPKAACS